MVVSLVLRIRLTIFTGANIGSSQITGLTEKV